MITMNDRCGSSCWHFCCQIAHRLSVVRASAADDDAVPGLPTGSAPGGAFGDRRSGRLVE